MRIAVTYENGQIFQHFGHTEQFKVYDLEDNKIVNTQVVDTNGQGHGALAGFLNSTDIDVLICGGIGGGAQAAVYQSVFGGDVYPSLEEKAANLLYFMIKDHPYADGCKRIAASLFLEFLARNNALYRDDNKIISDGALVAITLMIAESRPEEKDIMVNLVMNFLTM